MPTKIRAALTSDEGEIRKCVVAAFQIYTERIGKPAGPMLLDYAAEIRAGHVWIAEMLGVLAGVIVIYETAAGFYIDTVAATPATQGTGVGKALLMFAEAEARRRGHDSLYLCTNAKMTENQIFYPRIGYVEEQRRHEAGYDRVFYRKYLPSGLSPRIAVSQRPQSDGPDSA